MPQSSAVVIAVVELEAPPSTTTAAATTIITAPLPAMQEGPALIHPIASEPNGNDEEQEKKEQTAVNGGPNKRLHFSLIAAQVLFAGFEVLSRVAMDQGVGKSAFTFYRNCLATILLGIYGITFERKQWVRLSPSKLLYFFFLGFLGVTVNQMCYLVGLSLTSVIFASAIRNSIPIITFILATTLKMEKVNLKKSHGRAKLIGSLIGLTGSLVLSLYKGPVVLASRFQVFHPRTHLPSQLVTNVVQKQTITFFAWNFNIWMVSWHLGAIFLIFSCASFALYLILQASILRTYYKAPITFASISCFSSIIQLPLVAAAFEPNWMLWRSVTLGEALGIMYAGVIGSGIVSGVQSWAVHKGGPVIVAAYQPLETLITAFLSYFFLEESLHLGTLIGGTIVVSGLYLLVWGQKEERRTNNSKTTKGPLRHQDSHLLRRRSRIVRFLDTVGSCLSCGCCVFEEEEFRVKDEGEWIERMERRTHPYPLNRVISLPTYL